MPRRKITIEDLAKIKIVGDPQISPHGTHVLYTLKVTDLDKNKYFTYLWLSRIGDGAARQFTSGEVSDSSPRWSPDGSTIAFIRTSGGKEKQTQIWLVAADGGEPRRLTGLPEGGIADLSWSPDGRWLAFAFRPVGAGWTKDDGKKREENGRSKPPRVLTRVRYRLDGQGFQDERQHVWVCAVPAGKAKQVTRGDYDDGAPAWSPDGRTIAFVSNRVADRDRHAYRSDIWLVPAAGGRPQKIDTPIGGKSALSWSPDGRSIAYVGDECGSDPWLPANDRLWVVSRQGGDARCLSLALDRTVGNATLGDTREPAPMLPIWSRDGERIFFTVSDSGSCHLYAADLATAQMTQLVGGAVDVAGVTADEARRCFALLLGEPARPADVFVGAPFSRAANEPGRRMRAAVGEGALSLRQISDANGEWLKGARVGKPQEFWLTQPDGTRVQGWVLRPPDFKRGKKYPLLLYVHGGPHSQYGNVFFHEFQWHAARGYVVVYGNPRGSNGRENNFGACIHRDWGNLDYQDVMAVADHAASLPYVDEGRTAIAGGSYGGFMTNWVVGHTDRFRCAITDRSISNWVSMVGTSDFPPPPKAYWPGNPWGDDLQKGWDMSPLKYVEHVRTPILIIHSEGDLRCPIEQAEQWFTALKWLKQDAVFVRYPPEASHGMSRGGPIDLRFDRLRRNGVWLDRHLKNAK